MMTIVEIFPQSQFPDAAWLAKRRQPSWDEAAADVARVWAKRIAVNLGLSAAESDRLGSRARVMMLGAIHSMPCAARILARDDSRSSAIVSIAQRFAMATMPAPGLPRETPNSVLRRLWALESPMLREAVKGLAECFTARVEQAA
jgi:hypothetical protein